MKFLIFGTGRFYEKRKEVLARWIGQNDLLGFLDNYRKGTLDGKRIYAPEIGIRLPYDDIVLMSADAAEMRRQRLQLGVADEKILLWNELRARKCSGQMQVFSGTMRCHGKRVLILTVGLFYNGGALAAVHAVDALQERGWDVSIAAPEYDENFLQEVISKGISVIHCPSLPFVFDAERKWIMTYDIVLVNVFPMLVASVKIQQFLPVLWWIHESDEVYRYTRDAYPRFADQKSFDGVHILAVSRIAKREFEKIYPHRINGILPYGIPEMYPARKKQSDKKIGIAILGSIFPLKAQDIFLCAVKQLSEQLRKQCRFFIIGKMVGSEEYQETIRTMSEQFPEVVLTGELMRKELRDIYSEIDVIVSASRIDSLPITMAEGLQNRKICITSDATGYAYDIIQNGENGFICKAGDAASLAEKMAYVIEHFNELGPIREKARKTYEKYFSMEIFGERLDRELLLTEKEYWSGKERGERYVQGVSSRAGL